MTVSERSIFIGARLCTGTSCKGEPQRTDGDWWSANRCVSRWLVNAPCPLCPICDVFVRELDRTAVDVSS